MASSRRSSLERIRVVHRHQWLWETLENEPTFVLRSMFGAKAAYLGGKLMLCFCAREEPWRGVLVCTDRTHHDALLADFPTLTPHPILPKWLYLAETITSFETDATRLVTLARQRDPRLGVEPGAKKTKQRQQQKKPATKRRRTRPRHS